jgi:hypothetical protein
MRHAPSVLLAFLLLACADPGGPDTRARPASIDQLLVVKVSGDQSAPVPPEAPAPGKMPAWTSTPLVARIRVVPLGGLADTGDSLFVPPGTLVHWRVQEGCGELFALTTAADDSGYVANRWAPGTRAGTCEVAAGRTVGMDTVLDATWRMEVLAGKPVSFDVLVDTLHVEVGDTVVLPWTMRDQYGNPTARCGIPGVQDQAFVPHLQPLAPRISGLIETVESGTPLFVLTDSVVVLVQAEISAQPPPWGDPACPIYGRHWDTFVAVPL